MADIIQEAIGSLTPNMPSFSMSSLSVRQMLWVGVAAEIIIVIVFVYFVYFIWKNYSIRLVELEDIGKSFRARLYRAKPITENGVPKYQILGQKDEDSTFFHNKPLKIPAFPSDTKIPLRGFAGFYKDLIIVHKDKNGDHRPFKALISKDQFDLQRYIKENNQFDFDAFFKDLLPTLQIDNVKMRSWYKMKINEGLNIYREPGLSSLFQGGTMNLMMVLFVIFAIFIGAYMIFK